MVLDKLVYVFSFIIPVGTVKTNEFIKLSMASVGYDELEKKGRYLKTKIVLCTD